MAEPIEIVIRKTQETSYQTQPQSTNEKIKNKETFTDKAVGMALINAGKQIASYGIAQYGDITGNTMLQRKIDAVLTIAEYGIDIARYGMAGVVLTGVRIGLQTYTKQIEMTQINQQADLLYQRSGNATIDGGRGTND